MILFEQICNNLKMAVIGRNMLFFAINTIIDPYNHSCVFMTDIYLTIRNCTLWAVEFFLAYSAGNFALVLDVTIDQDICSRW